MDCNEEETEATKRKIYGVNPVISREYVEKNYIHKSKLIAKKQELEDYIQENSDEQGYWGRITQEEIYTQIDIIDELLGE